MDSWILDNGVLWSGARVSWSLRVWGLYQYSIRLVLWRGRQMRQKMSQLIGTRSLRLTSGASSVAPTPTVTFTVVLSVTR